tara:strand:- start:1709 stop:1990 length:282 start_codon:yes stop_codon:yes gene_type:complete
MSEFASNTIPSLIIAISIIMLLGASSIATTSNRVGLVTNSNSVQSDHVKTIDLLFINEVKKAEFSPFFRNLSASEAISINGYSRIESACSLTQ